MFFSLSISNNPICLVSYPCQFDTWHIPPYLFCIKLSMIFHSHSILSILSRYKNFNHPWLFSSMHDYHTNHPGPFNLIIVIFNHLLLLIQTFFLCIYLFLSIIYNSALPFILYLYYSIIYFSNPKSILANPSETFPYIIF